MVTSIRNLSLGCFVSGALLWAPSLQAQDAEGVVRLGNGPATGIVRISDQGRSELIYRGQSESDGEANQQTSEVEQASHVEQASCTEDTCASDHKYNPRFDDFNPRYDRPPREKRGPQSGRDPHSAGPAYGLLSWLHNDLAYKGAWFRGKCEGRFGHHHHDGPGRPLAGCYNMVYPVDPGYFDQRDGQVYAAPGYGGPVSVPLAPVVNSTYNYGWGIPSSRLTPVLHPATQAPVSQIPNPLPTAPVSY